MGASMGLVLDCHDPARLGQFWAAALGYANLGAFGTYVVLVDEEGKSPKLILQGVPEEKVAKNRMHVDIEVPDMGWVPPPGFAETTWTPGRATPGRFVSAGFRPSVKGAQDGGSARS